MSFRLKRKRENHERGFSVLPLLLALLVLAAAVSTGVIVWRHHENNQTLKLTNNNMTDNNIETLVGTAYMSPNTGEGMSIQYQETIDGQSYRPFQPLLHNINDKTIITNSHSQKITFDKIKVGDKLVVKMVRPICVDAIKGGRSGCIFNIVSIKDQSL